jgi:hypothetical protein
MHLANYAYRVSSSLIDWNDRFDAELCVLARPDHAGGTGQRERNNQQYQYRCALEKLHLIN